ncbi:3'(2'),5'-bisphosphate nucleotidase CysQ [Martelella endophytica]|nr:3'(2'),5'-bisphosphate nucleotidase CysQ [Martelella endophytica]
MAGREAGAVALSHFGGAPEVWWKNGGQSPVSAADLAANSCLEDILRKARPDYGWLSEESRDDPARIAAECAFVVDPIDGTRGFLSGGKTWVVSVAVVARNRPVAGVLVAPALDEIYSAQLSGPALKNGVPIAIAAAGEERRPVEISMPGNLAGRFNADFGARLRRHPHIPSLAYRLAMVADGRLDGTLVRAHSHDWDLAAADIILERAGGVLVDEAERTLGYNHADVSQGTLFAGHPALVSEMLRQFGPPDAP